MGNIALLLFAVTWVSVAAIALRRKLSLTIAIGGGFLCACVLVIAVITLADQSHPVASDTENIAAKPQQAAPPPLARPVAEPKEEPKRMYYVITPMTPVCSDFKAIVRVEAVVKLQNFQALEAILARTGCEILFKEMILTGDTPIRSMPAGIVVAELSTGLFFFADYHLTREQLTVAEAQRRMLAANPYR